jgi:hypothetical protein
MRSMVVGCPRQGGLHYSPNRAFQIVEHFSRGKAKNFDPALPELRIALCIPLGSVVTVMGLAIDFDNHPSRMTEEVGDFTICRLLAPELQSCRPLAQLDPKQHLRQRHFLPQLASDCDGFGRTAQHQTLAFEGTWRT